MDMKLGIDFSFSLVDYIVDIFQITSIVLFLGCTGAVCLGLLMVQIDIVSSIIYCCCFFLSKIQVCIRVHVFYQKIPRFLVSL